MRHRIQSPDDHARLVCAAIAHCLIDGHLALRLPAPLWIPFLVP